MTGIAYWLLVTLRPPPVLYHLTLVLDAVTTRSRVYENTKTFSFFDTVWVQGGAHAHA